MFISLAKHHKKRSDLRDYLNLNLPNVDTEQISQAMRRNLRSIEVEIRAKLNLRPGVFLTARSVSRQSTGQMANYGLICTVGFTYKDPTVQGPPGLKSQIQFFRCSKDLPGNSKPRFLYRNEDQQRARFLARPGSKRARFLARRKRRTFWKTRVNL